MKLKVIFFLILFSQTCWANNLTLEIAQAKTNFNYFQKPNLDSNRVNLPEGNTSTIMRLSGRYQCSEKWLVSFLIAPLSLKYDFISTSNFTFHSTAFTSGQATTVRYRFNSYRLGALRTFEPYKNLTLWLGPILKIRDAKLSVEQAGLKDSFSNVGPVPLIGFGIKWQIIPRLSIYSYTDALAASQGSAYDSQLELQWAVAQTHQLSFGKRIVGGGVDNEKLKNFAQFDSLYTNYTISI